jgi:UDP-N-acetylglucosamine/UDP-N-acetylgalactosamine diphosphorylase
VLYARALRPETRSDVGEPKARRQEAARQAFEEAGQGHVFAHWERLSPAEQERLLAQAEVLAPRLEALTAAWRATQAHEEAAGPGEIAPPPVTVLPEHGGDASEIERARTRGLELLAEGRVAAFVVAGGQGTRLGFDGPKGLYPVGPVTGRTLFRIQAQKIAGWRRRTGRALPWYVMTSPATHAGTVAHFEAESYFGLPREDVHVFQQETVPAFDDDGRFFLESPDRIFENPGGHGGSLKALLDSGSLDDMDRRGIDRIFYYQVDNPLAPIADPVFLGLHDLEQAEISCKVIRKQDPMEKVGVVALVDGRAGIVEYTELGDDERYLRDADDRLVYWAGNIAIHCFDTAFVRQAAEHADEWLPLHASRKKIPFVDAEGVVHAPEEPNGDKLERFVFDALPRASRVCVQEVRPAEEFAPIKNAEGNDSPATARAALLAQYRGWLAGTALEAELAGRTIEIDHARVDAADEAAQLAAQGLDALRAAIEVATENDATRDASPVATGNDA